jgi:cell division initiation protein
MSITALDIQQQSFGTSRHGYDPEEVDVFLERMANEVDQFNRFSADASARIRLAEERAAQAEEKACANASGGVTEDSISKAFIAAQRSADALKDEARREGEKVYREAEAKARDIIRESLAEKQKILAEIDRLRESCEKFRTEYLSLINHFQTDAQKLLPAMDELMPQVAAAQAAVPLEDFLAENNAATPAAAVEKDASPAAAPAAVAKPEPVSYGAAETVVTSTASLFSQGNKSDDYDLYEEDEELDIEEID